MKASDISNEELERFVEINGDTNALGILSQAELDRRAVATVEGVGGKCCWNCSTVCTDRRDSSPRMACDGLRHSANKPTPPAPKAEALKNTSTASGKCPSLGEWCAAQCDNRDENSRCNYKPAPEVKATTTGHKPDEPMPDDPNDVQFRELFGRVITLEARLSDVQAELKYGKKTTMLDTPEVKAIEPLRGEDSGGLTYNAFVKINETIEQVNRLTAGKE